MTATNDTMDRSFLTASVPELVKALSLDEKVSLLAGKDFWNTVPIPRLNIPSIKVTDGPNGARGDSFYHMTPASALPNATCIAASFSTPLVSEAGTLLAAETKARNAVCLLAPTVNIQRSPLGGRAFESFSEDPTLSGHIAAAYINALQAGGVSATIKHFVCNDGEHERMGQDSVVSERALREVYLRPFQIAHKLARPWAYMTAYNKVNGTHVSENRRLLQDVLRGEWGHDGLVMSDWYGTYSTAGAINAGLDLEMPGAPRFRTQTLVAHLLMAHKIDIRTLDTRAATVLGWVQKLAQLNPDLVYAPPSPEKTRTSEQASDAKVLRRVGTEGIVVLKNDRAVLPLKQGKVAVIGPNAKARVLTGGGSAQLASAWSSTPWEGLVANKPDHVELSYALGCVGAKFLPILDDSFTHPETGKHGFELSHYAIVDGKQAAEPSVTESWHQSDMFMFGFDHPDLVDGYFTEINSVFTAPIDGDYEFGMTLTGQGWLYLDDKLVIDNSRKQKISSAFFGLGTEEVIGTCKVAMGQKYRLRVVHDSRRAPDRVVGSQPFDVVGLRVGAFPAVDPEQAIVDAVAAAKAADSAVVVVGLNADWESEGYDRPDLSLPFRTDELVARVAAANPNTTVVVQAGSAIAMPWLDAVAGVVYAWYGGNECGNAIADIVYGHVNPSGRLPLSLPKRELDIAAHLNSKSARTKVHYDEDIWVGYKHHNARGIAPLFPFGHGLSYTTFAYSDLVVSEPTGATAHDWQVKAKVTVTNTGNVAGSHSVHFYTSPPPPTASSLLHPEHALQAFTKVYDLAPGSSETVEVTLDKYAISHWDDLYNTFRVEVGDWHVKVGVDAQTFYGAAKFAVADSLEWRGL